jgi:hypothetical protein
VHNPCGVCGSRKRALTCNDGIQSTACYRFFLMRPFAIRLLRPLAYVILRVAKLAGEPESRLVDSVD